MTMKKNSGVGKYLNPPFDPRILTIGPPTLGSKKLRRGRIVSADTNSTTGQKHGVHFLYNPVAVSASHVVSSDVINDPTYAAPTTTPQQSGQYVNIGSTSVDLLYDRTYELWDHSLRGGLAGRFGVYADVLAFYALLGITDEGAVATGGGRPGAHQMGITDTGPTVTSWQSLYPVNPISATNRVFLYIGDKMRFYGTIDSFSVTYSHWNHEMIPTRCQVSVSLQFQTDPANSGHKINRQGPNYTGPHSGGNPGPGLPGHHIVRKTKIPGS